MNVTTLSEPSVTRVDLEGNIDRKTAPQIREELSAALQQVRKLNRYVACRLLVQCRSSPPVVVIP
jgi:anti-anti-sigma regulatory factor